MEILNNIELILDKEFEIKMISKINNNPNLSIENENLKELCILLHNNIDINDIKKYFKWNNEEFLYRINLLIKENLVIKKDNYYRPNLMIISIDDFKYICNEINDICCEVLKLIDNNISLLKSKTLEISCFKSFNFKELSLFILSDVILDFIQIDNVENIVLKKDRTKHGNKYYYYSLHEKEKGSNTEALGIYGNQINSYGNNLFGVYGNSRNLNNFNNIDSNYIFKYLSSLNNIFENEYKLKTYILNELVNYLKLNDYKLNNDFIDFFNSIGIMKKSSINIPILTESEFSKLNELANIIKDDFIKILEMYKPNLYSDYLKSVYYNEISFEEYFIWWYHIFYSKVTDLLIEENKITLPDKNNFNYIIIKD